PVATELRHTFDARHPAVHLRDREPLGVVRRLEKGPEGRARMPAEAEPAIMVRRRGDGEYDARPETEAESLEAVEVRGQVAHPRAGGTRHALDRPEEATHHPDS